MTILHRDKGFIRLTGSALLVAFLLTVCPGVAWMPRAFATVRQDLERAQDLYDFAEFQQSLDLLTQLIEGGQLVGENARDAYVLRARCAVGLKLDAMARDDFCTVLRLDKTWQPDPVTYPRDEISVFEAASTGCPRTTAQAAPAEGGKPWYLKPVAWVAGGAVLLAAVVLGGGGGDETPATTLDDFPDPPVSK